MNRALSLQAKILLISCTSMVFIFMVMSVMHFRDVRLLDKEMAKAMRLSNRIALNGILLQQETALEKILTDLLNTDELLLFSADQSDKRAETVVRGLLASLDAVNGTRLTLYNADFQVVLQEVVEGLVKRVPVLPAVYRPLYQKTAEDFVNRFYFRHNESHERAFPVEYCGVTVLTDDDDKVTGYVEVALDVETWLLPLAELTGYNAGLYDSDHGAFCRTTDAATYKSIMANTPKESIGDGMLPTKVQEATYLSDILPILGPDGELLHWLWVTQDYSEQAALKYKNGVISVASITILSLASLLSLFFFLRSKVISPINIITGGLREGGERLDLLTDQVAESGQAIASGASQQAASLEETSASLEETSTMARQNALNAAEAARLEEEAMSKISQGSSSMDELKTAMQGISTASEETLKIVKTIDEIAFQTNLLALNAAVEAARAGEAGAGFAVVADEVRNLAMRAADAARETNELIEETSQKIKHGHGLVEQATDAFDQIVGSGSKVSSLVNDINTASSDQAKGIEQLNKAVAEMDNVTQQNAANAEESAAVAEEMASQTRRIKESIDTLLALVGGSHLSAGNGGTASPQAPVASENDRKALPEN